MEDLYDKTSETILSILEEHSQGTRDATFVKVGECLRDLYMNLVCRVSTILKEGPDPVLQDALSRMQTKQLLKYERNLEDLENSKKGLKLQNEILYSQLQRRIHSWNDGRRKYIMEILRLKQQLWQYQNLSQYPCSDDPFRAFDQSFFTELFREDELDLEQLKQADDLEKKLRPGDSRGALLDNVLKMKADYKKEIREFQNLSQEGHKWLKQKMDFLMKESDAQKVKLSTKLIESNQENESLQQELNARKKEQLKLEDIINDLREEVHNLQTGKLKWESEMDDVKHQANLEVQAARDLRNELEHIKMQPPKTVSGVHGASHEPLHGAAHPQLLTAQSLDDSDIMAEATRKVQMWTHASPPEGDLLTPDGPKARKKQSQGTQAQKGRYAEVDSESDGLLSPTSWNEPLLQRGPPSERGGGLFKKKVCEAEKGCQVLPEVLNMDTQTPVEWNPDPLGLGLGLGTLSLREAVAEKKPENTSQDKAALERERAALERAQARASAFEKALAQREEALNQLYNNVGRDAVGAQGRGAQGQASGASHPPSYGGSYPPRNAPQGGLQKEAGPHASHGIHGTQQPGRPRSGIPQYEMESRGNPSSSSIDNLVPRLNLAGSVAPSRVDVEFPRSASSRDSARPRRPSSSRGPKNRKSSKPTNPTTQYGLTNAISMTPREAVTTDSYQGVRHFFGPRIGTKANAKADSQGAADNKGSAAPANPYPDPEVTIASLERGHIVPIHGPKRGEVKLAQVVSKGDLRHEATIQYLIQESSGDYIPGKFVGTITDEHLVPTCMHFLCACTPQPHALWTCGCSVIRIPQAEVDQSHQVAMMTQPPPSYASGHPTLMRRSPTYQTTSPSPMDGDMHEPEGNRVMWAFDPKNGGTCPEVRPPTGYRSSSRLGRIQPQQPLNTLPVSAPSPIPGCDPFHPTTSPSMATTSASMGHHESPTLETMPSTHMTPAPSPSPPPVPGTPAWELPMMRIPLPLNEGYVRDGHPSARSSPPGTDNAMSSERTYLTSSPLASHRLGSEWSEEYKVYIPINSPSVVHPRPGDDSSPSTGPPTSRDYSPSPSLSSCPTPTPPALDGAQHYVNTVKTARAMSGKGGRRSPI